MVLKRGSKGESVKTLQEFLKLTTDGDFGPKTEAAVKDWQKTHGLMVDGVVGPKTFLMSYKDLRAKLRVQTHRVM